MLQYRSILKAGERKRGKLSKLKGNVSNCKEENGTRKDRIKKPIRLCLEPAGPAGGFGTLGPGPSPESSGPLGKWLLSRLGWMTHSGLGLSSKSQRLQKSGLDSRMDWLVLGLPGDSDHEGILLF